MPKPAEPVIVIHVSRRELGLLEDALMDSVEMLQEDTGDGVFDETVELLLRVRANLVVFDPDPNIRPEFYRNIEECEARNLKKLT